MRRWLIWGSLGALGLGGLVALLSGSREVPPPAPSKRGRWWPEGSAQIRELASAVESVTGWYGLTDFLLAVAAGESAANQYACSGLRGATLDDHCAGNAARGWFGMRPSSAYAGEWKHLKTSDPDLIRRSPEWAVATAVWYAYRMRNYGFAGQRIDWLAVRRGWALPRLVADVDEVAEVKNYAPGERSADVRERMEKALRVAGLPDSFPYEAAFPPGFVWPGFDQILNIVNAPIREATA